MDTATLTEAEEQQLQRAIQAFNSGDYYAAHDHFEALWGEPFWKGLVQAAVALHHYNVANPRGLEGLPESVDRILEPYRPAYLGFDVDGFLSAFNAFFEAVQRGANPPIDSAPKLYRSAEAPRDPGGRHVPGLGNA